MMLITDEQELRSAGQFFAPCFDKISPVKTYDDGFGGLYVYLQSCGPWVVISGVVRAQTWEDAFGIARDEFCTPSEDATNLDAECQQGECDCHDWSDNNGLVEIDPNERLEELSPELIAQFHLCIGTA